MARNVSFREKDLLIIREECRSKYGQLQAIIEEVGVYVCRRRSWRIGSFG